MAEKENLAIGPLFMVMGIATFFVVAVIFVLTGMHDAEKAALIAEHQAVRAADAVANDAMHAARLEGYEITDKEAGKVRIPINRAMEIVASERATK